MWRLSALAGLALAGLAAGATGVQAASLYWWKFPVHTQSEAHCLQFAYDVARSQGLQNIRRSALEVAGTTGNVYVSITCVGRGGGQNAMGIVMAAGDTVGTAAAVSKRFADKLKGIIDID